LRVCQSSIPYRFSIEIIKLLEILACPIDKHHPLELFENKLDGEKITEGALYCKKCSRFFPI